MHSRIAAAGGASVPVAPAPFDLVALTALAHRTRGSDAVPVGLIDGAVDLHHPDLADATLRAIGPDAAAACAQPGSVSCLHGTFTAGILAARRESPAPGICPASPLLIRPIFDAGPSQPAATPAELAHAIVECVDAGARVINLSAELVAGSGHDQRTLSRALEHAAHHGVIVVAAAGNQGSVGGSALARHPWVLPVAACDGRGAPLLGSNLGASIGRRGVLAPGDRIESLAPGGRTTVLSGTSASAAFVSGAVALAWSLAPALTASAVRWAFARAHMRRRSVVPPLLDASALAAVLTGADRSGGG